MSEKRMPVEQQLGGWVPPEIGPVDLTAAERHEMWQRGTARRRRRQVLQGGVAVCAVLALAVPLATGVVGQGVVGSEKEQVASVSYVEGAPAQMPSRLGGVPNDAVVSEEVLRPGPVLAITEEAPQGVWALSSHGTEFGYLDLPDFGSLPTLSPDGTRIAYWAASDGGTAQDTLMVVDLTDGTRQEQSVELAEGTAPEALVWADESMLLSTHATAGPVDGLMWVWDVDDSDGLVAWADGGRVEVAPTLLDSGEVAVKEGTDGWHLAEPTGGSGRMGIVEELSRTLPSQGHWLVVSPDGVAVENGPESREDAQSSAPGAQQIRVSRLAATPPGDAAYGTPGVSELLKADHAIRGYVGFHGDDALAWGSEVLGDDGAFDLDALFDGVVRIDTETGRSTEWVRVKAGSGEQPAMWQFASVLLDDAEVVEVEGPGAENADDAVGWAVPVSVATGIMALGGGAVLFARRRREGF